MAVDGIIGQCRRILFLADNLPIRHQTELDHRLKSITNSKRQTVSFIQELVHSLFHLCILECCRKEFCTAVRFIARRKAAREHDDLCLCDCLCKRVNGISDILCRQIAEYLGHNIGTCALKCDG